MLLALKEDSPPYALDPNTLETLGLYTFGGQLKSRTFSAHPKFDPDTGEMIVFGYFRTKQVKLNSDLKQLEMVQRMYVTWCSTKTEERRKNASLKYRIVE
jgi:carotenoid cleavage dioxygenase-like enzyme